MTEQQTTSTEIQARFEQALIVVKEQGSLDAVQKALVGPYVPPQDLSEVSFPPVPGEVVLTDDVKKALRRLPEVFATVQPTERRALTEEEIKAVEDERDALRKIASLLTSRDEDLKTLIRHHMDVSAEQAGKADPETTDRDAHGHYVIAGPGNPERVPIPGTNLDYSREYRAPKIGTDTSVLADMEAAGEISRETYLAMTREVRVFDDTKTIAALANKPTLRGEILTAIQRMTKPGKPGTSLFTRKRK